MLSAKQSAISLVVFPVPIKAKICRSLAVNAFSLAGIGTFHLSLGVAAAQSQNLFSLLVQQVGTACKQRAEAPKAPAYFAYMDVRLPPVLCFPLARKSRHK